MLFDSYDLPCTLTEDLSGVQFDNKEFTKRVLRKWKDDACVVKISKLSKKRSDAQNRWLWGVCYVTIAAWSLENFGEKYTLEEIHIYVCTHILELKYTVKEMFGEEVVVMEGTRTSKMATKEFMDAKEKIQQFYAPKGCVIPDPTKPIHF